MEKPNKHSKHIVIVEDDPDQRANYCSALEGKGYKVDGFADAKTALASFNAAVPELAVLDIVLGNEVDAGFQLCREMLQRAPNLPVLFLTDRIDEIDRISGLRMGAWDYQTKPITLGYFAERVASLLRLSEMRSQPQNQSATKHIGGLQINSEAMQVLWERQLLNLTLTEFRMVERLLQVPGNAVSYESLMRATLQSYVTNNTINTHMRNLRNKFRALDPNFDCIRNEYGFGYRWLTQ